MTRRAKPARPMNEAIVRSLYGYCTIGGAGDSSLVLASPGHLADRIEFSIQRCLMIDSGQLLLQRQQNKTKQKYNVFNNNKSRPFTI